MGKAEILQIRNSTAEFLTFAYQSKGNGIEVRVQNGTIWLSQILMADLFQTTKQNIGGHIKNILAEGELEISVVKDFFTTAADGKNYAENEFELFRPIQDRLFQSDYDKQFLTLEEAVEKPKKTRNSKGKKNEN